jgi:hypothetical protein
MMNSRYDLLGHSDNGLSHAYQKPRGIRGYKLLSDNGNDFTKWTVAGSQS